jgi:hypothetical protein
MPFKYKPKEKATRRNTFTKQQIANALEDVERNVIEKDCYEV